MTSRISGDNEQLALEDLQLILRNVNAHILPALNESSVRTLAGGSVANTIRGLAAGFGISSGIIGACGDDDQGLLFIRNMSFNGVDLSKLRVKRGSTGQCACLVDADGNRTMRPYLSDAVKLQANELMREDIQGSKWLVIRYAHFNIEIINTAIKVAKLEEVSISMDLASFEMVRGQRSQVIELLKTGDIDLCFANEDEARELIREEALSGGPESALDFLARHCRWAVVTLGPKGCIAKHGQERYGLVCHARLFEFQQSENQLLQLMPLEQEISLRAVFCMG